MRMRGGLKEVRWFDKREPKTQLVSKRSTKERGGTRQLRADASLKTMMATEFQCNANDAMMKCMTRTKCKTKDKNPTTKEISYSISRKGKSWSYEYGKLYPGHYNTPPLREDLVPRSRMAPKGKGRGI